MSASHSQAFTPCAEAETASWGLPAAGGYAAGTRITTTHGRIPVEALQPGELIINPWGEHLPVQWVGQRDADCRSHPAPHEVWPVRVLAHAFGPGLPMRDLVLSPDHAIYVDDVLVPARCLLNGATVVQEAASHAAWWHVELERHDILLAEGLATESYLDTGDRNAFTDGGPPADQSGDFARLAWETSACAELVISGPAIIAIRTRLLSRAARLGHIATADAAPCLRVDGTLLYPEHDGDWRHFRLPPGARDVRLLSRTTCAADHVPESGDRRRLGVAVLALAIDGKPIALDHKSLIDCLLPIEGDGARRWRWTDGTAALPAALWSRRKGMVELSVRLADWPRYWASVAEHERMPA